MFGHAHNRESETAPHRSVISNENKKNIQPTGWDNKFVELFDFTASQVFPGTHRRQRQQQKKIIW